MINGKNVLAVIPARGGSKGLPKKNIIFIAGKPLIAWSILSAKNSKHIDRCIVSTDDVEIANISKEYGGEVPEEIGALEKLPGVGHKTASVVMSQGFGHPTFPVDTHIHRLAQQWELTNGKNVVQTEKDLKRIFPEGLWNRLHLQIIFFGREYCQARSCDGLSCEICKTCFPSRKRKRIYKKA